MIPERLGRSRASFGCGWRRRLWERPRLGVVYVAGPVVISSPPSSRLGEEVGETRRARAAVRRRARGPRDRRERSIGATPQAAEALAMYLGSQQLEGLTSGEESEQRIPSS